MVGAPRKRKILLASIFIIFGFCLFLVVVSAVSNVGMPQHSPVFETLSEADKIRLGETQHLIRSLGDNIWAGWGQADIPAILYNESYAFLVGYPDPPAGWVKVPAGIQRGEEWEVTPGDTYDSEPYYRQALPDPKVNPEAFTVLVGERWVSSIATFDWMKISLQNTVRQDLPVFLRPILPYRLFIQKLVGGSENYISLAAHEAFHAYQGMIAPDKFFEAERINTQYGDLYPWHDSALQANWKTELDLLVEAVRSTNQVEALDLVRRFVAARADRRKAANLSRELVAYEQQREWLEGLARYTELEIWRQASTPGYVPIPGTGELPDFEDYAGFERRWSQELSQASRMANDEGDGRFYYSGMAQAFLLDRLLPGWKLRAFTEGAWLDTMLEEAVR